MSMMRIYLTPMEAENVQYCYFCASYIAINISDLKNTLVYVTANVIESTRKLPQFPSTN